MHQTPSYYARARENAERGYGSKTIGLKSSLCLIINNIMGPAMVALPYLTQRAGWLPVLLVNAICCVCSGLSSAMLCEALQRIPGNFFFLGTNPETGQRYEFCDAVTFYWGKRWSVFIRVLFNISLQAQNIPAMVVSCQVLDDLFREVFGHCFGLNFGIFPPEFDQCQEKDKFIITFGVVSCMLICIPFGCLNLDQNITFQNISFLCLAVLVAEFLVQFTFIGPLTQDLPLMPSRTPLATVDQAKTLGVVLFSWCFPSTLPSWINEKSPRVRVNRVLWISCIFSFFCKFLVALLGAWAYDLLHRKNQTDSQNILLVMDHERAQWTTKLSAYLFNFTTLIPGIPVIAVVVRYNLLSSGACGKWSASFFGVVLPWVLTVLLFRTSLFVTALNWAAMLCMGPVNFIVPPLVFLSAVRRFPQESPPRDIIALDSHLSHDGCNDLGKSESSFVLTGEPREERGVTLDDSAEVGAMGQTSQSSVVALSGRLLTKRSCIAQVIAASMASLVTVTILLNLYFLIVLREDIVD